MKNKTDIQMMPSKRTEKTYRIVLQHFEPDHSRYRDISSIRLEAGPSEGLEGIVKRFRLAIKSLFGG